MAAIRCEKLTKRYGDITALDNLDLAVEEHSVFGFLGPNGAGKTTTVKLLVGLSLSDSGRAWVAGREVLPNDLAFREKIGFLPDVPVFYNWMSGYEYLRFIGELYRLSSSLIEKRTDELLELVDLRKVAKRRIGSYSRGMRQRLGIAQALINHPKVLFMDEPTSALDPIGRRDILSLMERLAEETTIFMSSHILSDVERICDTVGIIEKGKLITTASIEELRRKYARSTFEIELEGYTPPLLIQLNALDWITEAKEETINGAPAIRVITTDITKAKEKLPQIIAQSRLTLIRYEMIMPSLEEVFVKLVESEND